MLSDSINQSMPDLPGLAGHLCRHGILDYVTAAETFKAAQQENIALTTYLVKSGYLSSEAILNCCAAIFGLPIFNLEQYDISRASTLVNPELICRYHVIPLENDLHSLQLGMADPTDQSAIAAIGFHTGLRIRPVLVSEKELNELISTHFKENILSSQLETALAKMIPLEESIVDDQEEQNDEPVIEFVDRLLRDAIAKRVSDIHLETFERHARIRFRCDGILHEVAIIPHHLATRITTRLKIMAQLNIAERRLPQDGRIQLRNDMKIDIRVNTCPALFGEKIVLRVLNAPSEGLSIDSLGLTDMQKNLFLTKLNRPQGLILVTGPTGSGKTMTLYSALHYLNQIEKNISSVEDPVEIELNGINQFNINSKIGLDFSTILRTLLRQDPDIIMIGEIRDRETAEIAMQAAQTGHLVLSTLHTNSAIETITRLQSMGIETYHIVHSISLIIAQRLARKLCPYCTPPITSTSKQDVSFSLKHSHSVSPCDYCYQGFHGRVGFFELLPMTELIANSILNRELIPLPTEDHLTLFDAGLLKVKEKITSYAELKRVLGSEKNSC